MFGLSDSLASQTQSQQLISEPLEPHVESFDIHSNGKRRFIFPFQVITYVFIGLVAVGFLTFMVFDDTSVAQLILWIQIFLAPFYFPGLYFYTRYFKKERHTRIELDHKSQLIKYTHDKKKVNILFHADQVEECVVNLSLLFPYRVDFLSLKLQGGPKIYISSLVVEPAEILTRFAIPYDVRRRAINVLPRR